MASSTTARLPLGPLMADLRGTRLEAEELAFLRQPALGGVILFTRNYQNRAQLRALVAQIKAVRSPALLVAVDQEGGVVQRFRDGFTALPALARIGECYDKSPAAGLQMAKDCARAMAQEVRGCGVDFSFAPVLDCQDLRSQIIGERAFHRDPAILCQLAETYIAAMRAAGMVATGKHFPGHGLVTEDSHLELPVDRRAFAEIDAWDLRPYAQLAQHLGGVMTAHVLFENLDSHLPTYSKFWLQTVLRQQLGFSGLIFSDDLSMEGAAVGGDILRRSDAALAAGCDMVLVCNAPDHARQVAAHLADHRANQDRLLAMRITQT